MTSRRLCAGLAGLLLALGAATPAQAITVPPGFQAVTLASNLSGASSVAWTPDGRMLVSSATGGGAIFIFNPGAKTPSAIRNVTNNVYAIATDANFSQNGFVYIVRTHGSNTTLRLTRVTLKPDNTFVNPTNPETVLLGRVAQNPCPPPSNTIDCMSAAGAHDLNEVISDPRDGTLWVANGDNLGVGSRQSVVVYNPESLAGKILHIDRDGRGLPGHPFCPTDNDLTHVCTKVHALGARNPFRLTLTPSGNLYAGDVGWLAFEEINRIVRGGNYGWPCYEGTPRTPAFRDDPNCAPQYAKEGTANADIGPVFSYPNTSPGAAIVLGPVYRGDSGYPSDFAGNLFYGDYVHQYVRRLRLGSDGNPTGSPIDFLQNTGPIVDLERGPNGNLVLVTIGSAGTVVEIRPTGAVNRSPTARISADKTSGPAPLTVNFRGADSSDPDGDALRFDWDFGDGTPHSSVANPSHVYSASSQPRTARLTVTDPSGASDTATIQISPGNRAPTATINAPALYRDGQAITVTGSATDPEQGTLPLSALKWHTELVHSTHVHDPNDIQGVGTVRVVAPSDHDDDSFYRFSLTATDAQGASATTVVDVRPETRKLTLASEPAGAPVVYGDRDVTAPFSKQSAIGLSVPIAAAASFQTGGHTYVFDRWSDGGARSHNITIPASDLTLTARYRQDDGASPQNVAFEAESMSGWGTGLAATNVANPLASGGRSVKLLRNTAITKTLTLPAGMNAITVRARGAQCDGPPLMQVTIDGAQVMSAAVDATSFTDYSSGFPALSAGQHTIRIAFTNDHMRTGCDRLIEVDRVTLSGGAPLPPPPGGTALEAEGMSGVLSTGRARAYFDATASGGRAVNFVQNFTITQQIALPAFSSLTVRASSENCGGGPAFSVAVDGVQVASGAATPGFSDHTTAVARPAGWRTVALSFTNDQVVGGCDRNLKVDKITFSP
jgi:glucose/arabinose dehydrogenase